MMRYDTVLIGATMLSLGYAVRAGKEGKTCAVIEAGCLCAPEFAGAWSGSAQREGVDYAAETREKLREMRERGISQGCAMHAPSLGPLAAKWFDESGADVLFLSRVTDVTRDGDGLLLTVHSTGGSFPIRAGRIVDTTADFDLHIFLGEPAPAGDAFLTAALESGFVSLPVQNGTSMAEARLAAAESWEGEKLLAFAPQLGILPAGSGHGIWQPSAWHRTAADAFEAGLRLRAPELPGSIVRPAVTEETCDIAVAGLGVAGSAAALRAARDGLRVIAVEQLGFPGGSNTAGAVQSYYAGVRGGVYRDFDAQAEAFGEKFLPCSVSFGKSAAIQQLLQQYGADTRYDACVYGVTGEENTVTGLLYRDREGLHRIRAKFVLDCTAEGEVCRMAGCAMLPGRETSGSFTNFSNVLQYFDRTNRRVWWEYRDNGVVNQYDPLELGHEILRSSWEDNQLPEHPDDSRLYLGIAPLIGIRQGLRIEGEETLRFSDYMDGRVTDAPVFWCRTNLDTHSKEFGTEDRIMQDWMTIAGMWGWNLGIPVPAGALIPKGKEGLLAAGRIFACDHNFAQGLRMMDDCAKSGEAAAVLAAHAIRLGVPAVKVPYPALQAGLRKTGCLKDGDGFVLERQGNPPRRRCADSVGGLWLGEEEIPGELATDCPGLAIWSARMRGEAAAAPLIAALDSGDTRLRRNAALALSLLGHSEAVPVLLEMLEDTGGYTPQTSYTYVLPHAVAAISALGRLHCAEAAEKLTQIVESHGADYRFQPNYILLDEADARFQYVSHALFALCEIGKAHPGAVCAERLRRCLERPDFPACVSMMGSWRRISFRKAMENELAALSDR